METIIVPAGLIEATPLPEADAETGKLPEFKVLETQLVVNYAEQVPVLIEGGKPHPEGFTGYRFSLGVMIELDGKKRACNVMIGFIDSQDDQPVIEQHLHCLNMGIAMERGVEITSIPSSVITIFPKAEDVEKLN